jgi:hypothetical protein
MIEDPVGGSAPAGVAVLSSGLLGGVDPEQGMERVPAGCVRGEQAFCSQPGQNGTRLAGRDPGQAGGRRSGDVGAGMHPEQPEYSRCPVAELPVGPPERCPHADGAVCAEHV